MASTSRNKKMGGVIGTPYGAESYTLGTRVFLTDFLSWEFVENGSLLDHASDIAAGPALK